MEARPDRPSAERRPPRAGRLRGTGGFTIIEFMVVLAIMGVLGAAAIAIYQDITRRAHQASDDGTIGALRSAASLHVTKFGAYPPTPISLEALITPSPPKFLYYTGYAYDPGTGVVTPISPP